MFYAYTIEYSRDWFINNADVLSAKVVGESFVVIIRITAELQSTPTGLYKFCDSSPRACIFELIRELGENHIGDDFVDYWFSDGEYKFTMRINMRYYYAISTHRTAEGNIKEKVIMIGNRPLYLMPVAVKPWRKMFIAALLSLRNDVLAVFSIGPGLNEYFTLDGHYVFERYVSPHNLHPSLHAYLMERTK